MTEKIVEVKNRDSGYVGYKVRDLGRITFSSI